MKIKVLFFSSIKDKLKKSSEEIELENPLTVEDFLMFLKKKYPEIADSLDSVMVAVNEEYVDKGYKLKENDTVAIIPPVSGG